MYIGIIVFRLLKLSDKLAIKTPTLLVGHYTFTRGGGARPPVSPRWLQPCN